MIKYKYRPGYGTTNYLIEINLMDYADNPVVMLLDTLREINPKLIDIQDLWQNDEVIFSVQSTQGEFMISKDILGSLFMMAEDNQAVLKNIDSILSKNKSFLKEQINPDDYTLSR